MSLEYFLSDDTRYPVNDFLDYNKSYKDWRLPENRLKAFERVYNTRIMEGELDHWLAGKIICDVMRLNDEQKAWYCLLFGFSYRNHWAMIVLQKFPKIWNVSDEEIKKWYEGENGAWSRACFAKDTKWNVRKFPEFINSIKNWLSGESLYKKIHQLTSLDDKNKNFDILNNELQNNLYGIGRMTAWLSLQTMYEFFNLNIDKWDFQLNDPATWSQYGALCYLANVEDWIKDKKKQTKQQIEYIDRFSTDLMVILNNNLPYHVDVFNVESCLCEFRKHWAKENPKEFTFWTAAELIVEFDKLYHLWKDYNVDWTPYILGLMTKGDHINFGYDPEYFKIGIKTGLNFNTHYYYDDEPDAYELLRIPRKEELEYQGKLIKTMYSKIDVNLIKRIREQYNPKLHTRWK